MLSLLKIWATCPYTLSVSLIRCKNEALKKNAPQKHHTLLEYDVTRRDPLSVVMDAGSRIVNFIRDGTAFG